MKSIFFLLLLLIGCGDDNGNSSNHNEGQVELRGNIYNNSSSVVTAKIAVFEIITTSSRLPDIYQNEPIQIDTVIINNTFANYSNLSLFIEIEDDTFSIPEYWRCDIWYDSYDENSSISYEVWIEYKEFLFLCQGEPIDPNIICDDNIYDCQNPYWIIDYSMPGDGLWKAQMNIDLLKAGHDFNASVGYGNSIIDVRDNHKARWFLIDNQNNILAEKRYIFDVIL